MPFPNEHSARIKDPDIFEKIRRNNDKFGPGVDVLWGVKSDGKTEIQSIRFDKKKFSVDQAKKWLEKHDLTAIKFEPATANESATFSTSAGNIATFQDKVGGLLSRVGTLVPVKRKKKKKKKKKMDEGAILNFLKSQKKKIINKFKLSPAAFDFIVKSWNQIMALQLVSIVKLQELGDKIGMDLSLKELSRLRLAINTLKDSLEMFADKQQKGNTLSEKVNYILEKKKSEFQKLQDNKVPLTDEERKLCFERKAVWHFHHGKGSNVTPAVWKSVNEQGKVTYVTNTHRAYNTASTLKGAINRFHTFIKGTA